MRTDELGDPQVARRLVDVERGAELDQLTRPHDSDAVGDGHRLFLVVRDEDHRRLDLAVDAHELRSHLSTQRGVETRERLVQQEELRAPDERLGDRDPLPLPAGELVDAAIEQRPDIEDANDFRCALGDLLLRYPSRLQGEADVVSHVEMGIERDRLEDHRDVPLLGRNVVHRPVIEKELTGGSASRDRPAC